MGGEGDREMGGEREKIYLHKYLLALLVHVLSTSLEILLKDSLNAKTEPSNKTIIYLIN